MSWRVKIPIWLIILGAFSIPIENELIDMAVYGVGACVLGIVIGYDIRNWRPHK